MRLNFQTASRTLAYQSAVRLRLLDCEVPDTGGLQLRLSFQAASRTLAYPSVVRFRLLDCCAGVCAAKWGAGGACEWVTKSSTGESVGSLLGSFRIFRVAPVFSFTWRPRLYPVWIYL